MDFDASRRDEVIKYVENKYGNKRVAQILTFSTLQNLLFFVIFKLINPIIPQK